MTTKEKLGFASYFIAVILIILFGSLYMFKPSFMPYHAEIVHLNWDQIPHTEQILVRALMIAVGGVTISVGIILGMLVLKYKQTRIQWVNNYVMISGIVASLLIAIAPLFVVMNSDSVPPLYFPVIIIALLVGGNLLTKSK